MTRIPIRDLPQGATFCFHPNRTPCYIEPCTPRPSWGGVPWQVKGKSPTGNVYCRPDTKVVILDQRTPHVT